MGLDRKKAAKKHLLAYALYADIRPPYKILVDDSFIEFCIKRKIQLQDQVKKLVGSELVTFIITQCCWRRLVDSHSDKASIDLARSFPKYFCTHKVREHQNRSSNNSDVDSTVDEDTEVKDDESEKPQGTAESTQVEQQRDTVILSSFECLRDYVGSSNKSKFIYCVYDRRILNDLRMRKDTPVIHFMDQQMVLAEPSMKSQQTYKKLEARKRKLPAWEKAVQEHAEGGGHTNTMTKKKRHGPRAPNPLSCKKRSTSRSPAGAEQASAERPAKKRCRSKSHRHKGNNDKVLTESTSP